MLTNVTKQQAARGQIETAIGLFLCDNDAISIHVLASASAAILTDVCRAKGVPSFRDTMMERVKPEYQRPFADKLNAAYNYFKHADNDPFTELERFNPNTNEMLLFACCWDFFHAYGFSPPFLHFFQMWFVAAHPNMMTEKFPYAEMLKNGFDQLHLKPKDEQRRLGRNVMKVYSLVVKQPLPLTCWEPVQPLPPELARALAKIKMPDSH